MSFTLIEQGHELTLNELASVLGAMPTLRQLSASICRSRDLSFARRSVVEAILPSSLIELRYSASFAMPLPAHITNDTASDQSARFPMKIIDGCIYTVPLKWHFLRISVPASYYEPDIQRAINSIWIWADTNVNEDFIKLLEPWYHVHTIESRVKLPSLQSFRRLRKLTTSDSDVRYSTLPSTLRSLKLISKNRDRCVKIDYAMFFYDYLDTTPLDINAPIPTVVHGQIHRLKMARPIANEQDLNDLLQQFPNLRYLSITLPDIDSHLCLARIFFKKHVRLPHLICLQAHGEVKNLWSAAPYEWLISNTDLKYSFGLFHAAYNEHDGLVVWL